MKSLTLKHLRYFTALASHGHFGRAADACSISQPALSVQIKEMEAIMGRPLVERAAREIRLTAFGEDILERAQDILERVDDLGNLSRRAAAPFSGRLRIGMIPTIAPYLLPTVIQALAARFPNLTLEPKETVTETLLSEMTASKLDLAIVALPISEPTLQEFALFEEEFLLVRSARDAGNPIPSPSQLSAMDLLLLEEGHCFRDQALSFCDQANARPKQIMEGSSLSTLVQMVGAGIGITLIPEMALSLEIRSAEVSVARFPSPAPSRSVGLIWRKSSPLSAEILQIGAVIRKTAEAHLALHADQNGWARSL
ncbi:MULTISPECIES: hydrogen peroxide-inducible genes activator [unclassified Ruegeria]|uniref:hydrogen peroxide-inducible genes activator n=1 Tax=unclassified Ruegeria TaxID=2625375 RepID=UPI00148874FF|nr:MULTISPECIES: hydrogen peroxide-inducible genes activator [unclassified Ruegeria]